MEIKLENGKIVIDPCEIFEAMEGDEKQELIEKMAWDSPIWAELKRGLIEDHGSENYNESLFKMRLEFLKDEDVARPIRDTIESLVWLVKKYSKEARDYSTLYWQWYYWHRQRLPMEKVPFDTPKYEWNYPNHKQVDAVLQALGITDEMLEQPLAPKVE